MTKPKRYNPHGTPKASTRLTSMGRILAYLLFASTCLGQVQLSGSADLSTLVGKWVIVQRGAFCTPGAYNFSVAFSGKPGKVISVRPSNTPRVRQGNPGVS